MAAAWHDKHFSITEERSVLYFSRQPARAEGIVTQAVLIIDHTVAPDEAFLSARPKAESDDEAEQRLLDRIDDDMVKAFTRASIREGRLVYETCRKGKAKWKLPIEDLRDADQRRLYEEAATRDVDLMNVLEEKRARHPLIMRAKYILRTGSARS